MNFKVKDKVKFKSGLFKGKIGVIKGKHERGKTFYTVFFPHIENNFTYRFGTTYSNVDEYDLIPIPIFKTSICIVPFWAVKFNKFFRYQKNWWLKIDLSNANCVFSEEKITIQKKALVAVKECDIECDTPFFRINYLYGKFLV